MPDFLLELRSEEIPARMQARAREDLARLFAAELARAGLAAGEVVTYATPRRLALIARDLPEATAGSREEIKGPRASAPPQALDGFLRKTGLTREALTTRDGVFFAVIDRPGRATADVLANAIPAIVRGFPWPKAMRWGAASLSTESPRWVRPLQGVVALFGDAVVACEVAGIASGAATVGHRFHHPGVITLGGAHDYVEKLRACHVIVDQNERAALIRGRAEALAAEAGLVLVADEGLVAENAGLTEWPVPLLGRFDAAFLDVPPEVIQLTARVNQKYFVCRDAHGALADAFVCVANIDATDGGARIVEGNRKVLAARLSDARFFYETDLQTPLEVHAGKLGKIVFHEKLGTVADKVERVAKLARWLCEEGIVGRAPVPDAPVPYPGTPLPLAGTPFPLPGEGRGPVAAGSPVEDGAPTQAPSPLGPGLRRGGEEERQALAALGERAARLAKADLVTGMVAEFPEVQGVMGGYYARAQGEPREVWEAVRDHYKPVGSGDEVPTAPVTVAVSLADKLDTLAGFFTIDERPTGSKDPYALRRAAQGIIRLVVENDLRFGLLGPLFHSCAELQFGQQRSPMQRIWPALMEVEEISRKLIGREGFRRLINDATKAAHADASRYVTDAVTDSRVLFAFFADRLKVQQREAGVRHDLIDAVFALGGEDDLVRLLARVRALQAFVGTDEGANLLAGYKRAANILKKEGWGTSPSSRHPGLEPGSRLSTVDEGGGTRDEGAGDGGAVASIIIVGRSGTPDQVRGDEEGQSGDVSSTNTLAAAEAALIAVLDTAEPRAADAVAHEDFAGAMAALAALRAPIDAFFTEVTVNDADPAVRARRLDLLARVRDAVHRVADFSRIEG